MRSIVIVSAECAPLAKTGGLGDMVAALAAALRRSGHDVRVVLPLYGQVRERLGEMHTALPSLRVAMGTAEVWCAVRSAATAEGIPLYLVEHEDFFRREGLYHDARYRDFPDNPFRFGFFCRAAVQLIVELGLTPDIVQVNDWHTALVPLYVKTWFRTHPSLRGCASVLTIHNASHQGIFPASHRGWLGLPSRDGSGDSGEDDGRINFLKAGIQFADAASTVSPAYAREIRAPGGPGLAAVLATKGERFRGILNGVDYDTWSPEKDTLIPARYSRTDMSGKAACKRWVQRRFHLAEHDRTALIGFIGRFSPQKGVDLLRAVVERVVDDMLVQVVILGSGEPRDEQYFRDLPGRYPGRIGSFVGFDDRLAHGIEAGVDFLVMPSRFEPCGLNQLYSLRYGALPIVRATGGLDDTVENYDEATGNGTGFKFWDATPAALYYTIGWAVSTYYDRPDHMHMLRQKAMAQDFGWARSVKEYEALFAAAREENDGGIAAITVP